jgi:zinc transport system substrate-binding protein
MVGMGLEERWGEQVRRQEAVSANIVTIADIARASLPEGEQLGRDPHLWVDPAGVRGWIVGVYDALPARLRRPRAEIEPFLARIDAVDAVYREALAPFAGAAVVTHHNAFGRMGRRYGIEISAVMVSAEGTEPSPAQIAEVRRVVETRNVRAMVVEPQFNDAPARRIAELAGVPVGVLDPLGADWFSMMQRNLETLTELLGKE